MFAHFFLFLALPGAVTLALCEEWKEEASVLLSGVLRSRTTGRFARDWGAV